MAGAMGDLQMARWWKSAADLPDMSKCFRRTPQLRWRLPATLHGVVFDILVGCVATGSSSAVTGRSSSLILLQIPLALGPLHGDRRDSPPERRPAKTWTQVCAGSKSSPADRCFMVGHAPPSKPANACAAPNEMPHDVLMHWNSRQFERIATPLQGGGTTM
jgi:hypothetical protein